MLAKCDVKNHPTVAWGSRADEFIDLEKFREGAEIPAAVVLDQRPRPQSKRYGVAELRRSVGNEFLENVPADETTHHCLLAARDVFAPRLTDLLRFRVHPASAAVSLAPAKSVCFAADLLEHRHRLSLTWPISQTSHHSVNHLTGDQIESELLWVTRTIRTLSQNLVFGSGSSSARYA